MVKRISQVAAQSPELSFGIQYAMYDRLLLRQNLHEDYRYNRQIIHILQNVSLLGFFSGFIREVIDTVNMLYKKDLNVEKLTRIL